MKIFLNKEPLMDGIGHCVETWLAFLGKQHLVYKALKLYTSIAKDPKLIFIQIHTYMIDHSPLRHFRANETSN